MREVARLRNLLSGFVTTLKRLFESVTVQQTLSGTKLHANWSRKELQKYSEEFKT